MRSIRIADYCCTFCVFCIITFYLFRFYVTIVKSNFTEIDYDCTSSASPRRKELLSFITTDFKIVPADIDETVENNVPLEKRPEYLAVKKALHISKNGYEKNIVIGCDTGVFVDGKMLGKPKNREDAENMLKLLSGRQHKVITGCCTVKNGVAKSFSNVTLVEFFELSDLEIEEYIATGEPFDKAGAYGIQGKGSLLVKKIDGDYFNVVGLPVSELNRILKKEYSYE